MNAERTMASIYLEWAKRYARARFNLAASGVAPCSLADLPVRLEDLELDAPDPYGYAPLVERIAARSRVPAECVVTATGTSMANHLAMAALLAPGDEAVIEQPSYEPLVAVARYLGATVRRFPRRVEQGFAIDPAEVARAVGRRTRLVALTNLHNPTGALADRAALEAVGEIAAGAGARVLVDEVYLEAIFDHRPASAFHLGPAFVATASLTKAYGLGGLRCGWALAEPELAGRMRRLNNLFGVVPAHPAERLSVLALDHLEKIAARARDLLARNRATLEAFLDSRSDLAAVRPAFGTIAFPRLVAGDVEELCARLRDRYETSVVPGRFFDLPEHFRIGIGGAGETVAAGLDRLGRALDETRAGRA
jgi:aspartate/methionine/tyrosine aminotransferase